MGDTSELETIRGILGAARIATLTTRSIEGDLQSRPMALVEHDFDGTLWFFTEEPSGKTAVLAEHPEVNVAIGDGKGHLSLSGRASVERDAARIDELWNPWAESWFERGRDDPRVALLRVEVETAAYWDTDRPAVVKVVELVKGLVRLTSPDLGETGAVTI